jgi:hypothetical protein
MQIFSLMSLYSITTATAIMRSNNHLWQGMQFRLKSARILQRLEKNILSNTCSIPITAATEIARKDMAWWQLNACRDNVNGIQYYYVMESFGVDPCAVVGNSVATYYRITLYALPELKRSRYLLQSTVALPVAQTSACQQKNHAVTPGRQGWREI